jgi:hypothetical protein
MYQQDLFSVTRPRVLERQREQLERSCLRFSDSKTHQWLSWLPVSDVFLYNFTPQNLWPCICAEEAVSANNYMHISTNSLVPTHHEYSGDFIVKAESECTSALSSAGARTTTRATDGMRYRRPWRHLVLFGTHRSPDNTMLLPGCQCVKIAVYAITANWKAETMT